MKSKAQNNEQREARIANDKCPECNGELDTGWECNDCRFDAFNEARKIDIDGYRKSEEELPP
jgi:hypothetical protein